MNKIITITVVVILLYLLYRIGGRWLLPFWQRRRMKKYKEQYFRDHPHISAEQYAQRKEKQQEEEAIIDHKKRLR